MTDSAHLFKPYAPAQLFSLEGKVALITGGAGGTAEEVVQLHSHAHSADAGPLPSRPNAPRGPRTQ